jgi:hypothetical protein
MLIFLILATSEHTAKFSCAIYLQTFHVWIIVMKLSVLKWNFQKNIASEDHQSPSFILAKYFGHKISYFRVCD